jgi:hypothetical protein
METLTAAQRLHKFIISILLSFIVWSLVNHLVVEISLLHFIIIEICIGIGELFSTFIKEQTGLETPKKKSE